jgi:hypothetical protein
MNDYETAKIEFDLMRPVFSENYVEALKILKKIEKEKNKDRIKILENNFIFYVNRIQNGK